VGGNAKSGRPPSVVNIATILLGLPRRNSLDWLADESQTVHQTHKGIEGIKAILEGTGVDLEVVHKPIELSPWTLICLEIHVPVPQVWVIGAVGEGLTPGVFLPGNRLENRMLIAEHIKDAFPETARDAGAIH